MLYLKMYEIVWVVLLKRQILQNSERDPILEQKPL